MKKKIVASLMGVIMALSITAVPAFADTLMASDNQGFAAPNGQVMYASARIYLTSSNTVYAQSVTSLQSGYTKVAVTLQAKISGSPRSPVTAESTSGSAQANVPMGPNDGSLIYTNESTHRAYNGGTIISSGSTYCWW